MGLNIVFGMFCAGIHKLGTDYYDKIGKFDIIHLAIIYVMYPIYESWT